MEDENVDDDENGGGELFLPFVTVNDDSSPPPFIVEFDVVIASIRMKSDPRFQFSGFAATCLLALAMANIIRLLSLSGSGFPPQSSKKGKEEEEKNDGCREMPYR